MSWSIKLFRVRGIEIKVHLTFVLILIWAAVRWGVTMKGGTTGALYGFWSSSCFSPVSPSMNWPTA